MEGSMIGALVAIGLALLGAVGGYFTYRAKTDFLLGLVRELRADHEKAAARADCADRAVSALELRIEREFVKKNDLQAVEDRIGRRIDSVAHDLKGATAQIIAAMTARPRAQRASE